MKKPIKIIAAIVAFVFVAEQIVYPAPQSALRPPASRVRKEEPSRRILDKQAPPIVMSISDTRHSASFKKGEYFIGKLMRSFGILCEDAFALRYFEEGAADNKIEIWAETEGTEPGERLITTIDLDGDGLPVGLDVKSTDSRGRFSLDLLEFQLQQEKIPAEHGLIERSALNGESSLHIHGIEYLGVQAYIDYLRKTGIQNIVGIKLIGAYRDKVEIFAISKNGKKTVVKKTHTISLNEKGRPEYCPGPRVDFRIALLTLLERQNNPIQIGLDRSDPNIIPLGYVNCHGLRIFLPFLGYREKNVAFFKRYDVKVKERVFEAKEIIDGGFGKAIFKVRLHDNGRPKGMDKNITAAHIADVLKGQGSLTEDGNKRFRSYRRACQGKPSAKVGHRRSAVAPKKRQTRLESPIPTGEPDAVGKKIETKKATAKNANAGLSPKKAAQITDEPIMTLVDKRPEELPVPASKPEKEILDTAPTAPDSSEQLRAIVDGQLSVRERHTSQSRVRYNGEGKKGKRIFAFSAPHKNTGHTRDVYIRNCGTLADGTAVLINTVPEEPRRVEARTRKDSHDLDEPGSFTLPSVISFYNPDTGTFNGYFSSELESRFSRWMDERTKLENPPDPLLFSLKDRRIFGKVKDRDVVIDSSEIQNMYNNEYVLIEFRQTSEGNRGVFVYLLDESGRPVALWQEGYLDNDTGDFTWKNKLKMLSLSDAEIERLEGMMWMLGYKPAPVYIGDWLKHLRNNRDGIIIIYYLDFLEGGLRGWDYKTIDAAKEFITNITKLAAEQKGELRIDELIATPESKLSLRQRKEIIIRKRLKTVEGYIHGLSTLLNPYDTEDLLSPHDTEEVTAVRNLIILKALSQAPLSLRITPQFQRKVSEFYLYDAPNEAEIHQAVAEYFASIPLESIPEDIIYGKKSLIATRRYKARIALENGGGSQMLLPSGITQYLRWVSTIPMLSRVGEILLAYKRDQGDKEARGKLVESNHALVIDVAKKRLKACRNLPSMELSLLGLINVGVLGLMKGVDRYRQERGTKVSTYVTHWIRQAINREIANTVYHIRKPEYAQTAITQLGRESRGAGLDLFDTVTRSEEIAGATSFGVDEVEGIRDTASVIAVSLGENGEAENWTQQGWGANGDDQTDVISERIFFANIQEKALEILKEIWPEKNWERNTGIFKLRVLPTLQGEEAFLRTREEVGKEFSVTHERVRQIESEWLDACKLAAMKSDMAPASYLESLERLKDGIAAFIDAEPKKVFSIKEIMKKFDLTRVTYKYLTEQLHEEGRITAVKMPRKRALRVTSVKTRSAVRKSIRHHLSIDQAA